MDISLLASALTDLITPILPSLVRVSSSVKEELLDRVEEETTTRIKEIWARLWKSKKLTETGTGAAKDLAGDPNNAEARQLLQDEIAAALVLDDELMKQIQRMIDMRTHEAVTINQQAKNNAIQLGLTIGNIRIKK